MSKRRNSITFTTPSKVVLEQKGSSVSVCISEPDANDLVDIIAAASQLLQWLHRRGASPPHSA